MTYNYRNFHDTYRLGDNLSPSYLKRKGFKTLKNDRFYYDKLVYKNIIKLSIIIDLSENDFSYEVINSDWKILYAPYYYWDGGKNIVLEEQEIVTIIQREPNKIKSKKKITNNKKRTYRKILVIK